MDAKVSGDTLFLLVYKSDNRLYLVTKKIDGDINRLEQEEEQCIPLHLQPEMDRYNRPVRLDLKIKEICSNGQVVLFRWFAKTNRPIMVDLNRRKVIEVPFAIQLPC
ncbi:MAG: hypothetical protein ACHQUC_09465 [Chlamydiales bacterium]